MQKSFIITAATENIMISIESFNMEIVKSIHPTCIIHVILLNENLNSSFFFI